jgi:hypothetical protein
VKAPRDLGSGRPLIDKLGVKPGMRVSLVGFDDPGFRADLASRGALVEEPPSPGLDLLFYRVGRPADLAQIRELRLLIHDAGAIWVLREKGTSRTVREEDVIEAGRAFDLVDNKIASFSHTLAAMRLVVPLNLRR